MCFFIFLSLIFITHTLSHILHILHPFYSFSCNSSSTYTFSTEEITSCTNKAAKGAKKAGINSPSCFFISCLTVSVLLSINTFGSSNDFIDLIIPFTSSFEINKINPFCAQTVPFPLFSFKSIYCIYS